MTADDLLLEWGRWARSENPPRAGPDGVAVAPFPAYVYCICGRADHDPGWGDYEAAPDDSHEPVDEQRAARTDVQVMRLPKQHVMSIKRAYYNLRPVEWEDLGAARRAFTDLVEGRTWKRAA